MNRSLGIALVLAAGLVVSAGAARAAGLGVEIWTDKGDEAVYQPGDEMRVNVKTTNDAFLLVYEIDTEGFIHVLYPYQGQTAMVPGGQDVQVPRPEADVALVVQSTVGQSYLVAVAATQPFKPLPEYLRPYSAQGDELGYVGKPDNEEGVTADGRIVGDPFVAMERIRRQVVASPDDEEAFATAYTTYYVHEQVKYPRYLCYDCHRPDQWAWWDGFDPYYTTCSAFSFRVNWAWTWGPSYWYGAVPYYVYTYRPDCPPRYYPYYQSGVYYSSWDGWNRWCNLWGPSGLRRYKSPPPVGYIPPTRWKEGTSRLPVTQQTPPGYMLSGHNQRLRDGMNPRMPAVRQGGDGLADSRVRTNGSGTQYVRKPYAERLATGRSSNAPSRLADRVRPSGENRGAMRPDPVYAPRQAYRPGGSGRVQPTPVSRYVPPGTFRREAARQAPRQAPRVEGNREESAPPPAQTQSQPPPQRAPQAHPQGRGASGGGGAPRVKR